MTSILRLGLMALITASSFAYLPEIAEAKWIPIFKCRQKPEEEAAPTPEPCPAPEPAPSCCPNPEPEPVSSPAPEAKPASVCCGEPPSEVVAPDPMPAPEPAPVEFSCCCCTEVIDAPTVETPSASEVSSQIQQYGMPELAEGETLVLISPLEVPAEEAATVTADAEK